MFSNLGISKVEVDPFYVKKYEKLLGGGIWCIIKMEYLTESSQSPFMISDLKPIQIPNVNINDFIEQRKNFIKDEWIDVLLRTIGMEPTQLEYQAKWHLIERLVLLSAHLVWLLIVFIPVDVESRIFGINTMRYLKSHKGLTCR